MSCASLLIKLDANKMKERPTAKLEIQRLSKMAGEPFVVTLRAIPAGRYMEFMGNAFNSKGALDTTKVYRAQVMIALTGLVDPSMKDKDLQEHYGASTPEDLIETVFVGAEITAMAEKILEISGLSGDVVKEVKN